MNTQILNGCNVRHTFTAGFVNFHLGEIENQPGHYKVWRQNPRETAPAWERQFTDSREALNFLCERGCNLANDQRRRTEGIGPRKRLKELER
jgi:hypothetical protein